MGFYTNEELVGIGFACLGCNVLLSRKASLYGVENISIGSNVRIDDFCILSAGMGGIFIGNYVHVAAFSLLIGRSCIRLFDFSNVSSRVSIYSSSDDYSGLSMTNPMIPDEYKFVNHADVFIGRHAIIGSGSVVLPGVRVGDGVAIGALSLVNRDCDELGIYAGVPIRRIGDRRREFMSLEHEFISEKKNTL